MFKFADGKDLLDRTLDMALIVFGVVLQHPPNKEAPASRHLPMYETKSSSLTPVDSCNIIHVLQNRDDMYHWKKKNADRR